MRIRTFLVLVSFSSCFNLAESMPGHPNIGTSVNKDDENFAETIAKLNDAHEVHPYRAGANSPEDEIPALIKIVNKDDEKFAEAFAKLYGTHPDRAGANSQLEKMIQNLESRLKHLESKYDQYNPEDAAKQFDANIERTPLLQDPKAAELKKLAQQSAMVLANKPSRWRYVLTALAIAYGGVVAALVIAGIYGMVE